MRFIVAFYELDRAFGGPEEGNWWFDTGRLERPLRVYASEAAAVRAAARANALLARLQRGHRPVGSVLYAGGRHAACVFKQSAPAYFPVERPFYS